MPAFKNRLNTPTLWGVTFLVTRLPVECESIRFFQLKFLVSPAEKLSETRNLSRKNRKLLRATILDKINGKPRPPPPLPPNQGWENGEFFPPPP